MVYDNLVEQHQQLSAQTQTHHYMCRDADGTLAKEERLIPHAEPGCL